MKKHVLFLLLAASAAASGQSVAPVLLGSATSSGAVASARLFWSVGEPAVATLAGPSNQITQGFWQPEVVVFTGTNAPLQAEFRITCLPNPVSDVLRITFKGEHPVHIDLFSVDGRLLYRELAITSGHVLPMASLPASMYWLQFTTVDGAWIMTQKIVKQ